LRLETLSGLYHHVSMLMAKWPRTRLRA